MALQRVRYATLVLHGQAVAACLRFSTHIRHRARPESILLVDKQDHKLTVRSKISCFMRISLLFAIFPRTLAANNTCNCTHAIDLGCDNRYRGTYFHRLNNCFFPMVQAFDAAARNNGCIFAEDIVAAPFASVFLIQKILFTKD